MSKLVEIDDCGECPFVAWSGVKCMHHDGPTRKLPPFGIPIKCPLPNAPQEVAPQKCPQDRCPKCGGLMIDITSGRQALYPQYVNDKTYACMVCHYREEGAHCADTPKENSIMEDMGELKGILDTQLNKGA